MPTSIPAKSLVLYKNRPALVEKAGDKFDITTQDRKQFRVREKDISLLHPGPVTSLTQLQPPDGDIDTACELLAGQTSTLQELAELAFDTFSPAAALMVWELLETDLRFEGTLDALYVRTAAEVAELEAKQAAREAEAAAWQAFLQRIADRAILPEDEPQLLAVEALALAQSDSCELMRLLNLPQTPEAAHKLLLSLKYWDETYNPYPARMGAILTVPDLPLPPLDTQEERLDLTHLPTYAIDDAGSQDPDDAVSLDGTRLWVHVADAAALVSPDSPIDLEARQRGATLYLPEGNIPMLPPEATPQLGLGLSDISPALSFGLDFDAGGEVNHVEIRPSWVHVTRLSYAEAEQQLDDNTDLRRLYELAATNHARRIKNGSVEIDLPEVKIRLVEGDIVLSPVLPLRSRTLVREAMLMAGEGVARFVMGHNIPFAFTTQPEPLELDSETEGMAGSYARRRSMKPRQFKSSPAPHAGLGLETYVQITSPLRRYLDLVGHQQLRAFINGEPVLDEAALLQRVGEAELVSGGIRRAERLSNRHWSLIYLQRHTDDTFEAVVLEHRGRQSTLVLPQLDFETRLHLRGDYPLNSRVRLRLHDIDLLKLEAYFHLLDKV